MVMDHGSSFDTSTEYGVLTIYYSICIPDIIVYGQCSDLHLLDTP